MSLASVQSLRGLFGAALLALVTSCSGGGGEGGDPLDGTWYGTEEQADGTLVELQVRVKDRRIERVRIDGADVGLTGAIEPVQGRERIYGTSLSDGTEGGFFLAKGGKYLAYLDEEFAFAVLQKGAEGMPSFSQSDIVGRRYAGITVLVDDSFEVTDVFDSEVRIAQDGSFEGSDSSGSDFENEVGGELTIFNVDHGAWAGRYESDTVQGSFTGQVRVFASPDKKFLGSWACDDGGSFPEDCSFTAWRAQ